MPSLTLIYIWLVWDGGGVEWMEWHSFQQVPLPALNAPSLCFSRLHSAITCTQPHSHVHVHVSTKQRFWQIQRTQRCHRSASAVGGAAESQGLHLRQWRLLAWLDLPWGSLRPGNLLFVHMRERDCSYYLIAQPYNFRLHPGKHPIEFVSCTRSLASFDVTELLVKTKARGKSICLHDRVVGNTKYDNVLTHRCAMPDLWAV